ncbi:MAG: hypothetical protein HZA81_02980 [Candidatus Taylorbacteria bacterium]|nr:hypothetical protein [Candidatus Taylorbacteria bacterium]
MFWNRYFAPSFASLVLVAALHWVASYKGLYWTLGWYDVMMHFLGGVWTALFLLWVSRTNLGAWLFSLTTLRSLVVGVIAVGVAWELYEIAFGFTFVTDSEYPLDTSIDLVMDTLGAIAVFLVYRRSIGKR